MGGSTDSIRVKNGANTLLGFPDAATNFVPVVTCVWISFSKSYFCLFKKSSLYHPESALLFDGPSVHCLNICLKNIEINGDSP